MSNTNDLISRGDAIDAVYERIKQIGYENNVEVLINKSLSGVGMTNGSP